MFFRPRLPLPRFAIFGMHKAAENQSFLRGFGGVLLGSAIPVLANRTYYESFVKDKIDTSLSKKDFSKEDLVRLRRDFDALDKQNLKVRDKDLPNYVREYTKTPSPNYSLDLPYNPERNTKVVITRTADPGIYAHELGHSQQKFLHGNVGLPLIYGLGNLSLGLSMLGSTITFDPKNTKTSRRIAIGGTLGYLPILLTEIDASRRGYNLMRETFPDRPVSEALNSFIGVPTYMIVGSSPLIMHGMQLLLSRGLRK